MSDYGDSDGNVNSIAISEEKNMVKNVKRLRKRSVVYDPKCDNKRMKLLIQSFCPHSLR